MKNSYRVEFYMLSEKKLTDEEIEHILINAFEREKSDAHITDIEVD